MIMNNKKIMVKYAIVTCIGLILVALGLLWFLQGIAVLSLCPILCFAECECLTGGSLFWAVTGAITLIMGMVIISLGLKRLGFPVSLR
jgi:hypothetical protein